MIATTQLAEIAPNATLRYGDHVKLIKTHLPIFESVNNDLNLRYGVVSTDTIVKSMQAVWPAIDFVMTDDIYDEFNGIVEYEVVVKEKRPDILVILVGAYRLLFMVNQEKRFSAFCHKDNLDLCKLALVEVHFGVPLKHVVHYFKDGDVLLVEEGDNITELKKPFNVQTVKPAMDVDRLIFNRSIEFMQVDNTVAEKLYLHLISGFALKWYFKAIKSYQKKTFEAIAEELKLEVGQAIQYVHAIHFHVLWRLPDLPVEFKSRLGWETIQNNGTLTLALLYREIKRLVPDAERMLELAGLRVEHTHYLIPYDKVSASIKFNRSYIDYNPEIRIRVLRDLCSGKSYGQIGVKYNLSGSTATTYLSNGVKNLLARLDAHPSIGREYRREMYALVQLTRRSTGYRRPKVRLVGFIDSLLADAPFVFFHKIFDSPDYSSKWRVDRLKAVY